MTDAHSIIAQVKKLAADFHAITGKPLGVTGEIAEHEAADALGLDLMAARSPGYDAERTCLGKIERIQIKGRWKRDGKSWGRVPSIATDKPFDIVMLVLLREDYELFEIWEASRDAVIARLDEPGSKSRNERRSMGVSQFKTIAKRTWPT
jgi:hypothetical protein